MSVKRCAIRAARSRARSCSAPCWCVCCSSPCTWRCWARCRGARRCAQQWRRHSLPAEFMGRIHGPWAVRLITVLLMGSCFGSAFAGLLGYSRIPYGAARHGHFFQAVAHVHPRHHIPHVSLLLVGGLTLFWSFFDLQKVIQRPDHDAHSCAVRRPDYRRVSAAASQPDRPRPFRIWLAPLPCGLALAGWLYVFAASGSAIRRAERVDVLGRGRRFPGLVAPAPRLALFANECVTSVLS